MNLEPVDTPPTEAEMATMGQFIEQAARDGWLVIRADSKEDAIALTKRFLEVAGDGECELRQLYEDPAL